MMRLDEVIIYGRNVHVNYFQLGSTLFGIVTAGPGFGTQSSEPGAGIGLECAFSTFSELIGH